MKKLLFISILLSLFSFDADAQSIKLRGVIKDSIGEPLELANIIATIKETGEIESYAITNYEGRYQLDLPTNNTYTLKASFLGLETVEFDLNVPEGASDMTRDVTLNPAPNQLDGVEIVYEMPVTVKGDTIVYNADSFTTGNERKLEDVMKQLPGVEVNDDGEIEVEGKTVSKVMVEGKDFFDGDSKLATKNIPADAVDKVEVLRNYNEVDQMRGLGNDQDNIAINIKLKEGKKNFWFGEVSGGIGFDSKEKERYLIYPKLFYYSPDYSVNIITDFNDIGQVPFTFRDYFNFTGGFRNFNRGGGTNFNINTGDLGFAVGQNNRANAIETSFLAANFSWNASKSLDISGFSILSDNRTSYITNTIRNYVATGITETTNNINDQRTQLGMLKMSAIYKPNSNFQLDYDVLGKTSDQSEVSAIVSTVNNNPNEINEDENTTPFSINQNINAYYTLDENNIFAGQVQHLYQDEDPFYSVIQDSIPFRGVFTQVNPAAPFDSSQDTFDPLQRMDRYDVNQQRRIKTNKLDAKVDYYYVINNKSNVNINVGATLSRQDFNSGIFQEFMFTGPPSAFEDDEFNNDVTFNFSDYFIGVNYKFKTGIFTFTPGATLHNYRVKSEQLGSVSENNEWLVLPNFNAIVELKKSENIRLNYSIQAQYTDVNNFAEGYIFNNYNRLFRGNRNLENAFVHNYNLTYFSFNMFNYTNVSANINYTRRIEAIKNNTQLAGITQVSNPINLDSNFADETLSAFARFTKNIKRLRFAVGGNVSWGKFNNIINEDIRESINFTQSYNGSLRTSFREWPNIELGYRLTLNNYDNAGVESTFTTHQPFVNFDAVFLQNFTFNAEWSYFNYTDAAGTIENTYSFLDANLYYREKDSKWEYQLQATNLLDVDFLNNDSFNENFNNTSQFFVLPRIVMLIVRYEL
ncbi:TonB-dependent receptor [Gilvibacter sp. SZ-19]|uniref:carboxypeptidase regulatory-like domain-containing protein n=1 Tax=Gilvibacter sp. SZ-19 TaxID=754429 RepID=UPI000B3D4AB7|nr:carboxypeptidase regulatory-like domain-containing protein [Gilvibacter sp. SZ-19]ARV11443.1 TonB-dependent receptor [Gilvibacter sp. SZ-19]